MRQHIDWCINHHGYRTAYGLVLWSPWLQDNVSYRTGALITMVTGEYMNWCIDSHSYRTMLLHIGLVHWSPWLQDNIWTGALITMVTGQCYVICYRVSHPFLVLTTWRSVHDSFRWWLILYVWWKEIWNSADVSSVIIEIFLIMPWHRLYYQSWTGVFQSKCHWRRIVSWMCHVTKTTIHTFCQCNNIIKA